MKIHVYSEIGPLKTVLLHRPGEEIENLTPEYLKRLLFDDIPFLKVAQREHDDFAKLLKENGVEVLYLEKLAAEAIKERFVKDNMIDDIIKESDIEDEKVKKDVKKYLDSFNEEEMIKKVMAGIRKRDIGYNEGYNDYPFLLDPMPNLYFTRDPFASIGSGITINSMRTQTRRRETLFAKYIFKYNPKFKDSNIPIWYDRMQHYNIEGGDELVLSKDVLAIGYSERTDKEAILKVAKNIFESDETFKKILIFDIPKSRAFMHLDTVFTMIDYDKFTIHPGIEEYIKIIVLTYDSKNKSVESRQEEGSLEKILSHYLDKEITLIRCGGGDRIASAREQWNDGSNTLAIAPGKVVTYERNYITNEILDKFNVEVLPIVSSELSRGRGGPRCMSMPLFREDLE